MRIRCVFVAMLAVGAGVTARADRPWVPMSVDSSGSVVVPVSIGAAGPFLFLLDTGSTHTAISEALADRLDMPLVARTTVLTSTGREWRPIVRLREVAIGRGRAHDVMASVAPGAQLAGIARGIEGIIGQDFLLDLNYTLDYRRKRLWWSAASAAETDTVVLPLVKQEGRYLVQASAGVSRSMLLVPDSGADALVMFDREGRTVPALDADTSAASVKSLSGMSPARTIVVPELRLGAFTMRNQRVAVVHRERSDALEGDGLLPLHLFASVSFNAREQSLVVRRYAE